MLAGAKLMLFFEIRKKNGTIICTIQKKVVILQREYAMQYL